MVTFLNTFRQAVERHPVAQKVMLGCGIAACALYVGMDTIAAIRYEGYHYADQTISELSAIGAPTRSFWIPLGFTYSALTTVFGLGMWSATRKRALRITGSLAAGVGILGFVGWPFAPMHQREVLAAGGDTWTDTMHLVLGGVSSLLFMLSIAIGANAFGTTFRRYSIASLVVILVCGAITGMDASKVGANEPTPWLGIFERITVFGSMLWYAVLGFCLLRAQRISVSGRPSKPSKPSTHPQGTMQVS